jgi:hypothetical protein
LSLDHSLTFEIVQLGKRFAGTLERFPDNLDVLREGHCFGSHSSLLDNHSPHSRTHIMGYVIQLGLTVYPASLNSTFGEAQSK